MNLWLYDKLKAIWRHNTVANENNEKIHCEDVQNDAPKCLKIRIFWRSFWLQTALKNFLRIFSSRYEYVKCCPRSYLSSALWIMVMRRTNLFLFEKVLTPPVTLDLGHASLYWEKKHFFEYLRYLHNSNYGNLHHRKREINQRKRCRDNYLNLSNFSNFGYIFEKYIYLSPELVYREGELCRGMTITFQIVAKKEHCLLVEVQSFPPFEDDVL